MNLDDAFIFLGTSLGFALGFVFGNWFGWTNAIMGGALHTPPSPAPPPMPHKY